MSVFQDAREATDLVNALSSSPNLVPWERSLDARTAKCSFDVDRYASVAFAGTEIEKGINVVTGPGDTPRVLIVDDEQVIADTLTIIFSKAGMEARAAHSAEQAIALIMEWVPNAAIVDIHLPGMSGIDFAIHLKAKYPECGLTLFSGHTSTSELLEKAQHDGYCFQVLAKPVHPSDLLRRVTRQLSGAGSEEPDARS